MQQQIENYIEYLFSLALQKSGNFADAEDLTQDVLLAACAYMDKGGIIENMKSWLSGTLNHKYYDMLRKKYKMPMISIDLMPEQAIWEEELEDRPAAEEVRREIAYLSRRYREVIIRHYLLGEKVQKIAEELKIPKGTVLSRLSAGREQMRKGIKNMEQYEKQSHTPERLELSCYGCPGLHGEPWSLTEGDMMKQNILIIAYDKPIMTVEIARALGIPTPYIEKAVDDLVKSELMSRTGNKVFTDFIITQPEDLLKNLDREIAFAEQNYTFMWDIISEAILELNGLSWVEALDNPARNILEYYYILHIFSSGIYAAVSKIIPDKETFPLRPDGGRWIAAGCRYPQDFDFDSYKMGKYCYSGERRAYLEKFLGSRSMELRVYDTQPDLNKYEHGPVEIHDDTLCKLLYILYKKIPFDRTGCNPMYLEDVPHLAKCGVLKMEKGQPVPAIPVISKAEYEEMDKLRKEYMRKLADWLEGPLSKILPDCRIGIPKHLEGRAAGFRQYSFGEVPMAVIKKAIAKGDFLKNVDVPVPPMVLIVEEGRSFYGNVESVAGLPQTQRRL